MTLVFLINKHPQEVQKLRAALRASLDIPTDAKPHDLERIFAAPELLDNEQLHYFVKESMRWDCTANLSETYRALRPITLGNIEVPRGQYISVDISAAHNNSKTWP